ncbi:hypothetical protein HPB48_006497 [Haemaphysalis longicornis]|uniref:Endonuclease/exonuclease/phosphatase domain-containing protein n=1 Tax=Haemaphysalis longicornis TaxID=44386 RepID=A0A9J6GAG0_HAELO|nr:hypothetical protein HPB48_006497 [Haemaphysalis longicornis]
MNSLNPLIIWQWNCRGLRKKLNSLKAYIKAHDNPPEIILLQEAYHVPAVSGYNTYHTGDPEDPHSINLVTLIAKHLTYMALDTSHFNTPYFHTHGILVKPNLRSSATLRVVNVYHHPRKATPPLKALFTRSRDPHQDSLILGDFNCHHTMWGYSSILPQGRKLVDAFLQGRYSLLNDTSYPTRIGNSVERDTNPELAFYQGTLTPLWGHLHENLGSDHASFNHSPLS